MNWWDTMHGSPPIATRKVSRLCQNEGNFPRKFNSISRYFLTFQGIFLLRFPGF